MGVHVRDLKVYTSYCTKVQYGTIHDTNSYSHKRRIKKNKKIKNKNKNKKIIIFYTSFGFRPKCYKEQYHSKSKYPTQRWNNVAVGTLDVEMKFFQIFFFVKNVICVLLPLISLHMKFEKNWGSICTSSRALNTNPTHDSI